MRVVLYDDETMEPLTVLALPSWMLPRLRDGDRIKLPIYGKVSSTPEFGRMPTVSPIEISVVRIWFERFHRNGQQHWFCFTKDSENALSLRSVFLPGQWPAVHEEYARGVSEGIVRALTSMLGRDE